MKLILQKDVKNLGKTGDQISVKKGFARNFLIPKGYAVLMNKNNVKAWEHQKIIIKAKKRKALSERKALIDRLSSIKLKFEKEAQKDNRLFGSVTAHEISQALEKLHNISVDKKDIHFSELKTVGEHKIKIHLDSENQTKIPLSIKGKRREIAKEEQNSSLNTKKIKGSSADLSEEENPNIDALKHSTITKAVSAEDLQKTKTTKAVSAEDLQKTKTTKTVSAEDSQKTKTTKAVSAEDLQKTKTTKAVSAEDSQKTKTTKAVSAEDLQKTKTTKAVSAEDSQKTKTTKAVSAEDLQKNLKEESASIHTAQKEITSQNKKKADTKQLQGKKEHKPPVLDKQETSSTQDKKAESSHKQENKQKESLKNMTSAGAKKAQKETSQKNQATPTKPSQPMGSSKMGEEKAPVVSSKKDLQPNSTSDKKSNLKIKQKATLSDKKADSKQAKPLEEQKPSQEKEQSSAKPKRKKDSFLKKLFQNK